MSANGRWDLIQCLKIKILIKTAPTCFGVTVTPSSVSTLLVLAEFTVVNIVN